MSIYSKPLSEMSLKWLSDIDVQSSDRLIRITKKGASSFEVTYGPTKTLLGSNQCIFFIAAKSTNLNGSLYGNYSILRESSELQKENKLLIIDLDSVTGNHAYVLHNQLFANSGETTVERGVRALISTVRSITPRVYNSFITSNNDYTCWCISNFNGVHIASWCNNIAEIRLAQSSSINLPDFNYVANIINKSGGGATEQEGFFINAGYYQVKNNTGELLNKSGNYIGVDDKNVGGYKQIRYSAIYPKEELVVKKKYDSYYELVSTVAPYYTRITPQTSGGVDDMSSEIAENISDSTLPALEADYTRGAMTLKQDFIEDFSNWKVNFIKPKGSTTNITIKNGQLIFDVSGGISGDINNTQTKTLVKKYTHEIDKLDLMKNIDSAISKSLTNVKNSLFKECLPYIIKVINKSNSSQISLYNYFSNEDNRGKYNFEYWKLDESTKTYIKTEPLTFTNFVKTSESSLKNILQRSYDVDLSLSQEAGQLNLYSLELFEAYTRGHDFIQENYTSVRPEERDPLTPELETSRIMSYDDNYFVYKYSGRNIDMSCADDISYVKNANPDCTKHPVLCGLTYSSDILMETDVTLGETYQESQYFVEAIKVPEWTKDKEDEYVKSLKGKYLYKDSFKVKNYLDIENGGFDGTLYTDDDVEVVTSYIDLLKCKFYSPLEATPQNNWCDCKAEGETNKECMYQKKGYCPYRFTTEKHPRKIRTLQQSKSNRFNLIQETSKVFEVYPEFDIKHERNGEIKKNPEGLMEKYVHFSTQKGGENQLGFRYEKNLNNISRVTDSSAITTKLFVENVDSKFSNTGVCSILTAPDNLGKNGYILDFSYYVKQGMIDGDQLQRDLYGIDKDDFSFLPRIDKLNTLYDSYSNLIINFNTTILKDLQATNTVNITGVETALEERKKVGQSMYQFKSESKKMIGNDIVQTTSISFKTSDTYKNYVSKYREHSTILWGLIESLFFSNHNFSFPVKKIGSDEKEYYVFYNINTQKTWEEQDFTEQEISDLGKYRDRYTELKGKNYCDGELFWRLLIESEDDYSAPFNKWTDFKTKIIEKNLYEINGSLGQYKNLFNEVKYWKREREKILNKINDLNEQFYQKYEPYIKEGTFSNNNYITDNEYYWAGVQVLDDSCEPKVTYSVDVVDINVLDKFNGLYEFKIGDITYIEDIDFFGINKHTGFPNKEKVLVSEIKEYLDEPKKNNISLQNYTTKFDDLFQSITASVQSLTFNENIYKRASNFTAKQYVTTESLQNTLDIGDLTLLKTPKDNMVLNETGAEGADIENSASRFDMRGEGIFFSTDGGETWDLGVGPKGINMDYAKFGSLDASKVQIVDGSYIYFLWDKDGINAYRNPAASVNGLSDFARFNKYGLSLIENNNIRLRAGYEYLSNSTGNNNTGDYRKELPLENQNVGFYLYNDKGQPIFKTETRSNYAKDNTANYSARLSLSGEMFVTNKVLNSGQVLANNVEIVSELSKRYIFENRDFQELATPTILSQSFLKTIFNSHFTTCFLRNGSIITSIKATKSNNIYDFGTFSLIQLSSYTTPESTINIKVYNNINLRLSCSYNQEITIDAATIYNLISNNNLTAQGLLKENYTQGDELYYYSPSSLQSTDRYVTASSADYLSTDVGKLIKTNSKLALSQIDNTTKRQVVGQTPLQSQISYYSAADNFAKPILETFYILNIDGQQTYWKNFIKVDTINTSSGDFSTAEVGIFINNKKSLEDSEERTNLASQRVVSGLSDEECLSRLESVLSGAERTFSIVSGNTDGATIQYNNVLSVLKNGVLYMGGTVKDYYGKNLNISGLEYLPDEIRIFNPSIMMSNNGQVWSDWGQFYCAYRNEDGTMQYTSYSLLDLINDIKKWSTSVSEPSTGTFPVEGIYINEDDIG